MKLPAQGNVQGLFYVAAASQVVCLGTDAALTTLAEDSESSDQWKVLTTMRFSLQARNRRQGQEGSDTGSSSTTDQLLFCWTGVLHN